MGACCRSVHRCVCAGARECGITGAGDHVSTASVVPILPVTTASTWSVMVLLLCTGACCRSVHGCVSAVRTDVSVVCTGACERGITGVGNRGEHGFV